MRAAPHSSVRLAVGALWAFVLGAGAVVVIDDRAPVSAVPVEVGDVVDLLPLQTSPDRRIVDTQGRDVLLRGANVNSLGEYWQGVPTIPATLPVSEADWDTMARHGFSVIRLVISWSRVEPVRDVIDESYLDQVEAYVERAAAHGIYTVIDMHQDAYSAFIFTTSPPACPGGTRPAKGWDGAPAWATLTDGLSTCRTNDSRNSSPAVQRAWNNFYDNVSGIRDEFAEAWAAVATRFAGRPEVAGYDLLNEPEVTRPAEEFTPIYNNFLGSVARAIRDAEADAGASFEHILFIEPALPDADPSRGLVMPDPSTFGLEPTNISLAWHNYAESIWRWTTIEQLNESIEQLATALGLPNWTGEYGFFNREPETLDAARRYAADEDRLAWGGAWWQWRPSCGDPHWLRWNRGTVVAPSGFPTHLNLKECPSNTDLGPNTDFLNILGRGFPRATPGRIVELRSDPDTDLMKVRATVDRSGGELVVWTPTSDDTTHPVNTFGLVDVTEHHVDGGRIVTARVARPGVYALWVGRPDEELVEPTTTTEPTTTSTTTAGVPPTSPAVPTTGSTGVGQGSTLRRPEADAATAESVALRTTPRFAG